MKPFALAVKTIPSTFLFLGPLAARAEPQSAAIQWLDAPEVERVLDSVPDVIGTISPMHEAAAAVPDTLWQANSGLLLIAGAMLLLLLLAGLLAVKRARTPSIRVQPELPPLAVESLVTLSVVRTAARKQPRHSDPTVVQEELEALSAMMMHDHLRDEEHLAA